MFIGRARLSELILRSALNKVDIYSSYLNFPNPEYCYRNLIYQNFGPIRRKNKILVDFLDCSLSSQLSTPVTVPGQCEVDAVMLLLVQESIFICNKDEKNESRKKEVMVMQSSKNEEDADGGETEIYSLNLHIDRYSGFIPD